MLDIIFVIFIINLSPEARFVEADKKRRESIEQAEEERKSRAARLAEEKRLKELAEQEAAAAAAKKQEQEANRNSFNANDQNDTTLVSPGGLSMWTSPVWEYIAPV